MRVADGLRRPAVCIGPAGSLADAERLMERHRVRHLVVVRDGRVVGLLTWDDIAAARPSLATTLSVGEIGFWLASIAIEQVMRRDPPVVVPETPLADAARLLRDWSLDALPVVQEGALVGLLTDVDAVGLLGVVSRR